MCITHLASYNAQTSLLYAATSETYNLKLESNTKHFSRCFISLIENCETVSNTLDTTVHNNVYEVLFLTTHSLLSYDSGYRLHHEFCNQINTRTGFFEKMNEFFTRINNNDLD